MNRLESIIDRAVCCLATTLLAVVVGASLFSFFAVSVIAQTGHSADELGDPTGNSDRPNVVLIMTDDQGWGDFGFHGNVAIQTPHLDLMAQRSTRFTNFYVSPVCSPTRASLMTGRYNYRTRSVDTYVGRSMMDTDEVTIAEALKHVGYRTGIFGKWHLGDCYPMRPIDQGFDVSVTHLGGGLCQPSDPLENNYRYTDPVLFRDGKPFQSDGFCTDVYFQNAIRFIEESQQKKQPFFAYIATNAPHGPFHDVPNKLKQQYLANSKKILELPIAKPVDLRKAADKLASIMAMITNVDQNVGVLFKRLEDLSLIENTLIIFMTDNGPNTMRFVGPYRGMKSGVHEGGVRSPLWFHWPARIKKNHDLDLLAAHIDIFPTIVDLCGGRLPKDRKIDGNSLWPAANGVPVQWPERSIVLQTHRGDVPQRFHHFMIRQGDWKLVRPSGFGRLKPEPEHKFELYNLRKDPGEENDQSQLEPDRLAKLTQMYSDWFDDVSSTRADNYAPPRIHIGTQYQLLTVLNRNEWRAANWNDKTVGKWMVDIRTPGKYKFRIQFRDALEDSIVFLQVGDRMANRKADLRANEATILLELNAGENEIQAWRQSVSLAEKPAEPEFGAYQVFCSLIPQ